MTANTSGTAPAKPSPHADDLSRFYWEGTSRGKLVLQRCTGCGRVRHYPQSLCPHCHSDAHDWIKASGRGRVHSWTVTHHAFHPAFAGELPYVLLTVDLEEGVRALGRVEGLGPDTLAVGLQVVAGFVPREDGFGDLTFRLV